MRRHEEQLLYHCDGNKKCGKHSNCYKNGGECSLTTDPKHSIEGTDTVTVDIYNPHNSRENPVL